MALVFDPTDGAARFAVFVREGADGEIREVAGEGGEGVG